MWDLLGLDANSQAKGEKNSLNSRRTEFETWDLGDRLRSALTGVTREQLEKLSGKLADTELEEIYGTRAARAKGNLGHLNSAYKGIKGQTKGEIISQIEEDEQKGTALQTTVANNPRLDPTTISPTASTGEIVGAGSKATVEHADKKEGETKAEEKRRYEESIRRAELAAQRSNDLATAQLALSTMQSNNQMQIAQMNNQLQMRKEDAREARLDRKDRQAAIQQMMAGLAQMGASIAI